MIIIGSNAVAIIASVILTAIGHDAGRMVARQTPARRARSRRGLVNAVVHETWWLASSSPLRSASCRPSAPECEENSAERNAATSCGRSDGCILSAQSMAFRNSGL